MFSPWFRDNLMQIPIRLRDHPFQISYGPTDDRLHDFYIPALSCSVRYDRMTGFFSSSALAIAAAGGRRLLRPARRRMRTIVARHVSPQETTPVTSSPDLTRVPVHSFALCPIW